MIFDRLLEVAATAPETSGLRQGEDFASYASLVHRIERLAAGFHEGFFTLSAYFLKRFETVGDKCRTDHQKAFAAFLRKSCKLEIRERR